MRDRKAVVYELGLLAEIAAEAGDRRRAGILWGAAEAENERAPGGPLDPRSDRARPRARPRRLRSSKRAGQSVVSCHSRQPWRSGSRMWVLIQRITCREQRPRLVTSRHRPWPLGPREPVFRVSSRTAMRSRCRASLSGSGRRRPRSEGTSQASGLASGLASGAEPPCAEPAQKPVRKKVAPIAAAISRAARSWNRSARSPTAELDGVATLRMRSRTGLMAGSARPACARRTRSPSRLRARLRSGRTSSPGRPPRTTVRPRRARSSG